MKSRSQLKREALSKGGPMPTFKDEPMPTFAGVPVRKRLPDCDDENTLFVDGFEEAFMFFGRQFTRTLAIYDYGKCVKILVERDGMSDEEAVEFLEFNTLGAWVGEYTPVFVVVEEGDRD